MRLEGSCHCGAVRFSIMSRTPYPYMRCYCTICRKTAGGGGYAINLMGAAETLAIEGADEISVYQAKIGAETSPARRHFCKRCGSALWLSDPRWPELAHPFASAIDTALPKVPGGHVHLMLASKPDWVEVAAQPGDTRFDAYPELSIENWHRQEGLYEDD